MQQQNRNQRPEDNKNLLIAVLLSIIVVMGVEYFTRPSAEELAAMQQQAELKANDASQATNKLFEKPTLNAAESNASPVIENASARATIKSDRFDGSVAAKGGRLDVLTLKNHYKTVEKKENIKIFTPEGERVQFFDAGWIGVGNTATPDGNSLWSFANKEADLNQPLVLTWSNGQGVAFQRTYIFEPDTYAIRVIDGVTNESNEAVSLVHYAQVHQAGQDYTQSTFFRYFGPEGVFDKEHFTVDLDDVEKTPYKDGGVAGWAGISDEYFLAAIVPDQQDPNTVTVKSSKAGGRDFLSLAVQSAKYTLQPGAYREKEYQLYAGPKEIAELEKVGGEDVLLTRAIDYGWFHSIANFFHECLMWIFDKVGNLGVAIIIMTLLIKIALFPLANKSYRAMAEMKKLQPKMQQLRERYENDREKMTLELMALYRQHKVNPASGCWPMLIQIPIFFAFYKMILISFDFRQEPFMGWIVDMSVKDPYFVLPLLMGASMYVQQLISPQAGDPIQQKVMRFMPVIFTFVFLMFPSGLVLYWLTNNVISVAQQWYMMKKVS